MARLISHIEAMILDVWPSCNGLQSWDRFSHDTNTVFWHAKIKYTRNTWNL